MGLTKIEAGRRMQSSSSLAEWLALRKLYPTVALSHPVAAYGVGAGDSAGDGASVAPSVFGGVFFVALWCFGDGVGVALAAAGAVVVAVVPCCWQEEMSTMPSTAVTKHNVYLFIGFSLSSSPAESLVALKTSQCATNEAFPGSDVRTLSAAKARVIYPRDTPLDPSYTGKELCQNAIAEISSRAGIGRR